MPRAKIEVSSISDADRTASLASPISSLVYRSQIARDGADRDGRLASRSQETMQYFVCIISYIVIPGNLKSYYIQLGRTIGVLLWYRMAGSLRVRAGRKVNTW